MCSTNTIGMRMARRPSQRAKLAASATAASAASAPATRVLGAARSQTTTATTAASATASSRGAGRIELGFPHDFLAQPPIRDLAYGGTYDSIDKRS